MFSFLLSALTSNSPANRSFLRHSMFDRHLLGEIKTYLTVKPGEEQQRYSTDIDEMSDNE